jgi:dihydroflavonol-4-reductase
VILLSGAGGLLGAHIAEQAMAQGLPLRCVTRQIRARSYLAVKQPNCQIFDGIDLASSDLPAQLFKDVKTVIHCAGNTTGDQTQVHADNRSSTERLYEAAAQNGVEHFIQISSIATLSSGSEDYVSENHVGLARQTTYALEKAGTDQWLEDQKKIACLSILYPTFMLGAWDSKPSSGGILLAMRFKKLKTMIEGQKNFVAARDVAAGVLKVAAQSEAQRLILAGHNVSLRDFVLIVVPILKIKAEDFLFLPKGGDISACSVAEQKLILDFCQSAPVKTDLANKRVGYQAGVSLEEMLRETYQYFRDYKMIF